jgi:hypothetical protein
MSNEPVTPEQVEKFTEFLDKNSTLSLSACRGYAERIAHNDLTNLPKRICQMWERFGRQNEGSSLLV